MKQKRQGLYDPIYEHDACGIGFFANLKGRASHETVEKGLTMLQRQEHRGGKGSDGKSGDGAGIMLAIPHKFFVSHTDIALPEQGEYGVAMVFLPRDPMTRNRCEQSFAEMVSKEGQQLLGWRTVPVDESVCGESALESRPFIRQLFIGKGDANLSRTEFERKLYLIRKQVEKSCASFVSDEETFYVASLSTRTIVFKGMLMPEQIDRFYVDLQDETFVSHFALVHSRFSTNTFPSWERAHPNRYLVHNGEINTLRGNMNWMNAREKLCASHAFGEDIDSLLPVIDSEGSDSAALDSVLEFLTLGGRSLPHAAMMMIPEPWDRDDSMEDPLKAFYEYHSMLMEPWDGPTSIAFCDGTQIGAMLDRNGLRPGRYYITNDDHIVYASEVGVLDVPEETIVHKDRLQPGQLLLVDFHEQRIVPDEEAKRRIAEEHPYREWLNHFLVHVNELPDVRAEHDVENDTLLQRQVAHGYTYEELNKNILPMITEKKDPVGSMGFDAPLAVLSKKPQLLYNYFKQLFAQVTNPAIDSIREESITSTMTTIGAEGNLLEPTPQSCQHIRLESPLIGNDVLARLRANAHPAFHAKTISAVFPADKGTDGLEPSLEQLFAKADKAVADGHTILVLSDQNMDERKAALPMLLAVSGLHHHLIRNGTRTKVSLIAETGEARDVHQFAMLIGYGADAVNPYLAISAIKQMVRDGSIDGYDFPEAVERYLKTAISGVVKVLSKMGISTIQSYRGAQIFEAIGIGSDVIERYFAGTASQIGGIGLETIAEETLLRHRRAYNNQGFQERTLDSGSDFQWRHDGEYHKFHAKTIHTLQQAVRRNDYELYKKYSQLADEEEITFLRDMLTFADDNDPVPLEEVEPVESIFRRFKTGAMSYGSISQEAHEALAIAMNRIGGRSNSGEGGEDPNRFTPDSNGDLRRSSIKQVASGRFGVSSHYLTNADEIQIKVAQGAKPGEGGQLPGSKVYPWIAEVRGSTPGVGLISPPPHHDIYSIEDLAQLIHDLKNANPSARVNVKLVSKSGVGTIAAGVAKGLADVILISGYEGGTGAAARTSIKNAGLPWELGLSETHQTLVLNDLRDRVVLETDGKMMTGRDVVMAALLGAEEYGFSTGPLVALGCVIMRACHLNTCPVGIATQDPELRKKFMGTPDHIVNFMTFIAQEVREIMAMLGFRTIDEMIGRTDQLHVSEKAKTHWKAQSLDLSQLLHRPNVAETIGRYKQREQDHQLDLAIDRQELIEICAPALHERKPVRAVLPIKNTNRVVGTMLGHEVTKRYGAEGLPENTINLYFKGSAGQSFGAFVPRGITLHLEGDANDYVGKGLSGGTIIIHPSKKASYSASDNIAIGNVAFYGATSGEAYINGRAGERFCVRNSGVRAVVEGIGNHGCEYMTGGRVVVLGSVGKNFAAGMSGGIAYVLPVDGEEGFRNSCNPGMVELESLQSYDEINEVKRMIENHVAHTNSTMGKMALHHWNETVARMIKVIPKDYKQMLQSIEHAKRLGLNDEDAAMAAFEMRKSGISVEAIVEERREPVEN
ncbi:MAG TPA: glutamate synthase large subunit [Bacillales bacterium]|nr:glutamate synthase large subunit [Bacillales bacterium]